MNKTGRWTFNDKGNEYWENDDFETRNDAIEAAFADEDFVKENVYKEDHGDYMLPIATGEIKQPKICDEIDLEDSVIDYIQSHHGDNYGEYGCEYLDNVTKEQRNELNELLTKVIDEWATRNGLQPSHYLIENTEEDDYLIDEGQALVWALESGVGK